MKKSILTILIIALTLSLAGCVWVDEYPDIPTSYAVSVDDSIPLANMESAPLGNSSRGFRGEVYINLGMNEAYPGKGLDAKTELVKEIERYSDDDVHLLQVYVYIGKFYNTDITSEAFAELAEFLSLIRENKMKVLLRFAYETGASEDGPRTRDIVRHLGEIKEFMSHNIELIDDTLYAVQMGLIGLWGEGHGAHHSIDVGRVAVALDDAIPRDIPLMVRTPEQLKAVPKEIRGRFGVHDDYLVGYSHEWGMMDWDDANFPLLMKRCKHTLNDAEMPWGKDDNTAEVDMIGMVQQAIWYGLTSMSAAHNYKENGGSYVLERAKSEYLTRDALASKHMPYNPMLLEGDKISVYDYLKHHLGYQLVASNLVIEDGKASFLLTNFGMAEPFNYTMNVYVDGKRVEMDKVFACSDLTAFGQMTYSFAYSGGEIAVELVNMRDNDDRIALYNDIEFKNGKNIILAG